MTFWTLMFDWPRPLSYHIRIASGVLHCLSPCFYLMLSFPSVYHLLSHVIFALTVKKRSTVRGEICSTMPRLTASSASSRGVQLLTGRSDAVGASHARAMICMNCSKGKVAGAPGRASSVKRTSIALLSQFRLSCGFDGLQTGLGCVPAIPPASHRFVVDLLVLGNLRVTGPL